MLEIRDLTVRFGPIAALQGVSLHVSRGEFVTLVGLNGAGKSTALAAVAGLVRPSSGSVWFGGETLGQKPPEEIARLGIALVPEGRRMFRSLTVEENLRVALACRGNGQRASGDMQEAVGRFAALRRLWKTPAGRLSGGEQQQLAICRALVARPRLLLLDEPSLGLAPKIVDDVFAMLSDLHSEGMAILLVEQNAVRAVGAADRGYILRRGKIVAAGLATELSGLGELSELYLGS